MKVAGPRTLLLSLLVGLGISLATGSLYAWLGQREWSYGVGTMSFIVGVIALALGLLGAVEPAEGWATKKKQQERRSMAIRLVKQAPAGDEPSGWALALWGVIVGAPLIALAFIAWSVAAG